MNTNWTPNPGAQTLALRSPSFELFYGGQVGGGKTAYLLAAALRCVCFPGYRALLMRRTFPELESTLIARSQEMIPAAFPRAYYIERTKRWTFPLPGGSFSTLEFGHLEKEKDLRKYLGREYQFLGIDEASTFSRHHYTFLLTRLRSSNPAIPVRARLASNPGGEGHVWLQERFSPWLGWPPESGDAPPNLPTAEAGQILWTHSSGGSLQPTGPVWSFVPTVKGSTRTFIPARLEDTPQLNAAEYDKSFDTLDLVTRAQLRKGDWKIRAGRGTFFKREWFPLVDRVPEGGIPVRAWDLAATEPHPGNPDPDWTAGLLVYYHPKDKTFTISDLQVERGGPGTIRELLKRIAKRDGQGIRICSYRDPAAAGKSEAWSISGDLLGWAYFSVPITGNKVSLARPVSAAALAGRLRVVRGYWNDRFFSELEAFPTASKLVHDDIVDALSLAFLVLLHGAGEGVTDQDVADLPRSGF